MVLTSIQDTSEQRMKSQRSGVKTQESQLTAAVRNCMAETLNAIFHKGSSEISLKNKISQDHLIQKPTNKSALSGANCNAKTIIIIKEI